MPGHFEYLLHAQGDGYGDILGLKVTDGKWFEENKVFTRSNIDLTPSPKLKDNVPYPFSSLSLQMNKGKWYHRIDLIHSQVYAQLKRHSSEKGYDFEKDFDFTRKNVRRAIITQKMGYTQSEYEELSPKDIQRLIFDYFTKGQEQCVLDFIQYIIEALPQHLQADSVMKELHSALVIIDCLTFSPPTSENFGFTRLKDKDSGLKQSQKNSKLNTSKPFNWVELGLYTLLGYVVTHIGHNVLNHSLLTLR